MELRRSVLVAFAAERMFDLIEAAEHYPAFLPWCSRATILERDDSVVAAEIGVDYRGARFTFATRCPKRRPEWLAVKLVRGPFRQFEGEWQLKALSPSACRIDFVFRYEMLGVIGATIAGSVFDRIANTLVDAYIARAESLATAEQLAMNAPTAKPA